MLMYSLKREGNCALPRFSLDDQEIIRLAAILPPSSANNIQVVEQEIFFSRGQIF